MLTLVTWNLDGLEPRHLDVRTEAACTLLLLRPDPPDIVAVQEVIDRTWLAHLRPHFGHAGYTALQGRGGSEYYCALFVRAPLLVRAARLHPLPDSAQGRTLLEAEVQWGERDLRVLTAHLESLREGAAARRVQLAHVARRLLHHEGPAVFAGDTNLRDAEVADVPEAGQLSDAWEQVGRPPQARFTWDTGRIPNKRSGRPSRLRFDRVFLNRRLRAERVRLVGDHPLEDAEGWMPSDHLGVQVVMEPVE